jgi:hypothetical protein
VVEDGLVGVGLVEEVEVQIFVKGGFALAVVGA